MRFVAPLLFACLLSLLAACSKAPLAQQEAYVFGTRVEVLVAGVPEADARAAVSAVLQEFDRLHRAYHAWQPSELTQLNEAIAAGKPRKVSPELRQLLQDSQAIAAKGQWLFDPAIGRLVALWGFHADEFKPALPDPNRASFLAAARPSLRDLSFKGDTVSCINPSVAIDLGGYLKGVALDRAAAILKERGIRNALINIGGNVLALGEKNGNPWRVGIQHPRQAGPLASIELKDGEAIGTSGDYQRYFELDGKRYSHLIDPRTGFPAPGTQAVTVLIPPGPQAGTLSDALSKPLFIAGAPDWRRLAQATGVTQALRVDGDGSIQVTKGLSDRLKWADGVKGATVISP
jgi:thiamine biosynthesis lipoprotein